MGTVEGQVARLQAELELARASEERLRRIVDGLQDTVAWRALDGRILWASAAAVRASGYSLEELVGLSPAAQLAPASLLELQTALASIADGAPSARCELEFRHRDGSAYWLEQVLTPLQGESGELRGALCVGRDIGERREVLARLAESERRWRLLTDITSDVVWTADLEGRYTWVSPSVERFMGVSPEWCVGRSLVDRVLPEDQVRLTNAFAAYLALPPDQRPPAATIEFQAYGPDGGIVDIETTGSFVFAEDGTPLGIQGATRWVTERRRAEQALRESEASWRGLFNSVAEAIYIQDFDGRFLDVNDGAVRMYGYTREELLGQTPAMLSAPGRNDFAQLERCFALAAAGQPQRFEWWGQCRDGRVILKEVSVSRGVYFGQEVLLAMAWDVTESRAARKQAEEQQALLDALVSHLPLDAWARDLSGRVILQSQFSKRLWGDMEGAGLGVDEVEPATLAAWLANNERALAGETVREDVEISVGGEVRQIHEIVTPFRLHGQIGGVMGVNVDITEIKRSEEERRRLQAQILEARKRESLGLMAGGVAHDFNNLLTAILGFSDLALAEAPADSALSRALSEIGRAAQSAADLCRQMLAYTGKAPFVVRPVGLSGLVRETTALLTPLIPRGVHLMLDCPEDLPTVRADVTELRQVIMNLVLNGVEAVGTAPGEVVVSTRVATLTAEWLAATAPDRALPAGDYVCLAVRDSGCGMDEEALGRLFDPFYSTKFAGRGLGLSVVHGIVSAHGGLIGVESRVGHGSLLQVYLPVDGSPAPASPAPAEPEPWQGSGQVLVVDDEPAVRRIAHRLLHELGFVAVCVSGGHAALAALAAAPAEFAAVLLDFTMPDMDGAETLKALRAAGCRAPVLLSSGYTELTTDEATAGLDLAGLLQKPYRLRDLSAALQRALKVT